jgi:hypothetical protein
MGGFRSKRRAPRVTLKKDSKKIAEAITDNFGDFPFDDLDEKSENNTLKTMHRGYRVRVVEVNSMACLNMGTIM